MAPASVGVTTAVVGGTERRVVGVGELCAADRFQFRAFGYVEALAVHGAPDRLPAAPGAGRAGDESRRRP